MFFNIPQNYTSDIPFSQSRNEERLIEPAVIVQFNSPGAQFIYDPASQAREFWKIVTAQEQANDILSQYLPLLDSQWEQWKNHFNGIQFNEVQSVYFESLIRLFSLEHSFLRPALTSDKSIHLSLGMGGLYKAFIEIFFEPGEPIQEVVLNIFFNKNCILAYAGDFEEVLEKLEFFVDKSKEQTPGNIWPSYDLPNSFTAAGQLQNY